MWCCQPSLGVFHYLLASRPLCSALTQGLAPQDPSQQCVGTCAGVRLASGSEVHADLVVDCSGRQGQMPQWLAAAGLPVPRVSQVDASLGYASW
jgi:hypothetical protein